MPHLKDELKKRKAFDSLEQEAFLSVLRTCSVLAEGADELFERFGISATQYNVLRILRGAGAVTMEEGIKCGDIADRMVSRDPDITRLLDRLEQRGLITRARGAEDRRVVRGMITPAGLKILKELDGPVVELHKRQLGHLGVRRLRELIGLLELARDAKVKVKS